MSAIVDATPLVALAVLGLDETSIAVFVIGAFGTATGAEGRNGTNLPSAAAAGPDAAPLVSLGARAVCGGGRGAAAALGPPSSDAGGGAIELRGTGWRIER